MELFSVVKNLLHIPPEADHSTVCFEKFAQHFADRASLMHFDLDAVGPVEVTLAPSCPMIMNTFQYMQSDYVDRLHGEVKATISVGPLLYLTYKSSQRGTG